MKKHCRSFLISLFMGIGTCTFAQLETFDLSSYKLPYLKRQSLDLNLSQAGEHKYFSNKYELNNEITRETKENQFATNIGLNYHNRLNSEKVIHHLWFSSSFSNSLQDSHTTEESNTPLKDSNKNFFNDLDLKIKAPTDIYANRSFFWHINPKLEYSHNYHNNKNEIEREGEYPQETTGKSHARHNFLYSSLGLGFGWGRVEFVQDARLAVYILQDLKDRQCLTVEPTHEEVRELASQISTLLNERVLDSRRKRIYEMKMLDQFLKEKEWISNDDATYFTTLYDNWEYSNLPLRRSGTRFSLTLTPEHFFNREKSWEEEYTSNTWQERYDRIDQHDDLSHHTRLKSQIKLINEKPLDLWWQRRLSLEANYSYGYQKINYFLDKSEEGHHIEDFNISAMAIWGWIPNSRTQIDFGGISHFSFFKENQNYQRNLFITPSIWGIYYFSPHLTAHFNFAVPYRYQNLHFQYGTNSDNHLIQVTYELTLHYTIF